jgi:hypothetical protein
MNVQEFNDRTQLLEFATERIGKLEALGSPDQIADHLVELELQAVCCRPTECAIAMYLINELEAEGLEHLIKYVVVNIGYNNDAWRPAFISVAGMYSQPIDAPNVATFARGFDRLHYPELVMRAPFLGKR